MKVIGAGFCMYTITSDEVASLMEGEGRGYLRIKARGYEWVWSHMKRLSNCFLSSVDLLLAM